METADTLAILKEKIQPIIDNLGAEIVEITLHRTGKKLELRLLVDKDKGIAIDECALISRQIGHLLEQESIINERYLLEVSSPGLDRSLKTKRDFERVIPDMIDIWLSEPANEKSFISGNIKSAEENGLFIEVPAQGISFIEYDRIRKAKLKI